MWRGVLSAAAGARTGPRPPCGLVAAARIQPPLAWGSAGVGGPAGSLGPEELPGPPRPVWGEQVTHPREGAGVAAAGGIWGGRPAARAACRDGLPSVGPWAAPRVGASRGGARGGAARGGARPPTGAAGAGGGTRVAGDVGAEGVVLAPRDWPHLGEEEPRGAVRVFAPGWGASGRSRKTSPAPTGCLPARPAGSPFAGRKCSAVF